MKQNLIKKKKKKSTKNSITQNYNYQKIRNEQPQNN